MPLAFNRSTVEEIDARTGLAFPRLQFAPHFVGPELPALRRVVADILPRQSNAVCRRELCTVLGRPVAQEFFEAILGWHERERIFEQILSHPTKLCDSGLLFLVRQARVDPAVLRRLRLPFDECLLDLAWLGWMAVRYAELYDLLSGGEPCRRLSAVQCWSVMCWQVPENDRHFIRAKFVPNYGIVTWAGTAEGDRVTRLLGEGFERTGAPGEATGVEEMQLRRLGEGESLALRIDVRESEGMVRTVVVTRLLPDGGAGGGSRGRISAWPGIGV